MNEALRLYPVVPVNFRQANKDATSSRGGGWDGMGWGRSLSRGGCRLIIVCMLCIIGRMCWGGCGGV
jgi:hypothetical protein